MKPHYTELRLRTGVFANHSSRKGSKVAWSTKQAVTPSWKSGNAGFQVDLRIVAVVVYAYRRINGRKIGFTGAAVVWSALAAPTRGTALIARASRYSLPTP